MVLRSFSIRNRKDTRMTSNENGSEIGPIASAAAQIGGLTEEISKLRLAIQLLTTASDRTLLNVDSLRDRQDERTEEFGAMILGLHEQIKEVTDLFTPEMQAKVRAFTSSPLMKIFAPRG